jgi:sigma-B regulation protein RsbU (phosphoserine phosphatase)
MFVTLFFCKFDLTEKQLSYCNAGHLPGLHWQRNDDAVTELQKGGPIIGQFPDLSFVEDSLKIGAGDRLVLFTDGLTEAMDDQNNLFGNARVKELISHGTSLSPQQFCYMVKEHVDEYSAGAADETRDDFTLLQIMVK